MANRLTHNLQSLSRDVKEIQGTIKVVGAASAANNVVTMETGGYGVASVARSGAGEYTITLEDAWIALESANITLQAATAIDLVPQIKSTDVVSAKTIVFSTLAAAVPTDTANTITHRFHFSLKLKNSSVR